MNVRLLKPNNTINFNGIYKVQIPHKAFHESLDKVGVIEEVHKALPEVFNIQGRKFFQKAYTFFEKPFLDKVYSLAKNKNLAEFWADSKFGIKSLKEGYHTLFVATKKHKRQVFRLAKNSYTDAEINHLKNAAKQARESLSPDTTKLTDALFGDHIFKSGEANKLFDEKFKKILAEEHIETIEVKDLKDLGEVLKREIDI